MEKKPPKITVSGATGSGKSTIMVMLMDALRLHGFDVEVVHDCVQDYDDFINACTTIDKRRKKMKSNFKNGCPPIILEEHRVGFSHRFGFDAMNQVGMEQYHHIIEKVPHGVKD